MSTTGNGRNAKSKWSAYGWQCDMIGIPAVRHSDTGQESPLGTFIYRLLLLRANASTPSC